MSRVFHNVSIFLNQAPPERLIESRVVSTLDLTKDDSGDELCSPQAATVNNLLAVERILRGQIPLPVVEPQHKRRQRTLSCISADIDLNAPTAFVPMIVVTDKDSSESTNNDFEDPNTIVVFENDHNYASADNIDGSDTSLNSKSMLEKLCGLLKSCAGIVSFPYRLWRDWRFLPREDDVTQQLMCEDAPDKFTNIDIQSRKFFPLAFCILLSTYFLAYTYYLTDEFPAKVYVNLRSNHEEAWWRSNRREKWDRDWTDRNTILQLIEVSSCMQANYLGLPKLIYNS